MRKTSLSGWDLLIKVGGSLGRGDTLPPLMQRIGLLAVRKRVLVVPGGGVFADLVRRQMTRLRLDEATAHLMALFAMDQYGLLLSSQSRRATVVDNLKAAELVAEAGRVPVLLPSSLIRGQAGLERSFRLTSDSIAAHLAGRVRASQLVLLKSFRRPTGRLRDRAEAEGLARRGLVDPLFPGMVPAATAVWILCGREPAQLDRFMPAGARPRRGDRARPRTPAA